MINIILFIFLVILLSLNVNANRRVLVNDTCDSNENWTISGGIANFDGKCHKMGNTYMAYKTIFSNLSVCKCNLSIELDDFKYNQSSAGVDFLYISSTNGSILSKNYIALWTEGTGDPFSRFVVQPETYYKALDRNVVADLMFRILSNSTVEYYVNGVFNQSTNFTFETNGSYFSLTNTPIASFNSLSVIENSFNSKPNATNVSITTPIDINSNVTGYCLYNDSDNDIAGGNQTFWYVNKSIISEANNTFVLLGGNTSNNANITFACRYNDSFDWSDWVNSTTITVSDNTPPSLFNISVSKTSYTSTENVNITAVCQESNFLNYVRVTTNKSNVHTNNTMTRLNGDIFQFADVFAVGNYNIPYAYCSDTSNNIANITTNLTFSVSSALNGGGTTSEGGGGGGGGTIEQVTILGNLSLILKPPVIKTNFIYAPFKNKLGRFSISLTSNKVIEKCISKIFECKLLGDNLVDVALNYSNDMIFITKVSSPITFVDKAGLAKTIDAEVRFINIAYSVPLSLDFYSRNYRIFRLSENGMIIGIRVWFLMAVLTAMGAGGYFYYAKS